MREFDPYPTVDFKRLEVQLWYGLCPLGMSELGGECDELFKALRQVRAEVARLTGLILDPIHVRDNMKLPKDGYAIVIDEVPRESGSAVYDGLLVLEERNDETLRLDPEVIQPVFGCPGRWITQEEYRQRADSDLTVHTPISVIATHLGQYILANMHDLLTRDNLIRMVEECREKNPYLVNEVFEEGLDFADLERIILELLRRRLCVRNLGLLFEKIHDHQLKPWGIDLLDALVDSLSSEPSFKSRVEDRLRTRRWV